MYFSTRAKVVIGLILIAAITVFFVLESRKSKAYVPAGLAGYTFHQGMNGGDSLGHILPGTSPEEWADACDQTPMCQGFGYNGHSFTGGAVVTVAGWAGADGFGAWAKDSPTPAA